MRTIYRILSRLGDLKAASRGPGAYGRRGVRRYGHRWLAKAMRKNRWLRP